MAGAYRTAWNRHKCRVDVPESVFRFCRMIGITVAYHTTLTGNCPGENPRGRHESRLPRTTPQFGGSLMYALLLTAVLFVQAPETPKTEPTGKAQSSASLDGNWTVVCYEKNGQAMAEATGCQVMVKDNLMTFTPKDDKTKMMAIRIECGSNGTIKATEVANSDSGDKTETKPGDKSVMKTGVCVKTQDYVAICIHEANGGSKTDKEPVAKTDQPASTESKSYCSVVLKRAKSGEGK